MATLNELIVDVASDLRDPTHATFSISQVEDLINAGMMEVGRIYPRETITVVTPVADTYEYEIFPYSTRVFRVEWWRDLSFHATIPEASYEGGTQSGWEYFSNLLHVPKSIVDATDPVTDEYRVWGYSGRARLTTGAQVAQLDDEAEFAVRAHCKYSAYGAMLAERALFKQWQAGSQNSDISPNQLQGMVALYSREWEQARNRLRTLRRV